jgi:hypothetical protein
VLDLARSKGNLSRVSSCMSLAYGVWALADLDG